MEIPWDSYDARCHNPESWSKYYDLPTGHTVPTSNVPHWTERSQSSVTWLCRKYLPLWDKPTRIPLVNLSSEPRDHTPLCVLWWMCLDVWIWQETYGPWQFKTSFPYNGFVFLSYDHGRVGLRKLEVLWESCFAQFILVSDWEAHLSDDIWWWLAGCLQSNSPSTRLQSCCEICPDKPEHSTQFGPSASNLFISGPSVLLSRSSCKAARRACLPAY